MKNTNTSNHTKTKDNTIFARAESTPIEFGAFNSESSEMSTPINPIKLLKEWLCLKYEVASMAFKNFIVKLPWLKLSLLFMVAYLFLFKDLTFTLGFKTPHEVVGDDQESRQMENTVSLGSIGSIFKSKDPTKVNEFAPAEVNAIGLDAKGYIKRYAKVAVSEMNKFGIPASIKLAQALLESHAGNSRLATQNNNHFGIKCFSKSCKPGHCANFEDDHHKDFFRKYKSVWESYRSHSNMLANGRYKVLKKHKRDYKKWAQGLKQLGYATDKKYAEKLIRTIEKYNLDKFDKY